MNPPSGVWAISFAAQAERIQARAPLAVQHRAHRRETIRRFYRRGAMPANREGIRPSRHGVRVRVPGTVEVLLRAHRDSSG